MKNIKRKLSLIFRILKKVIADPDFKIRKTYTKVRKKEPLNEKMIFYEAYHGSSMTGNPLAVFTYLINEPAYKEYKHVWVVTNKELIPDNLKNHPQVTFVKYRDVDY